MPFDSVYAKETYTATITLTYNNGAVVTGDTEFEVLPADPTPTPTPTSTPIPTLTPTHPQTGDSGGIGLINGAGELSQRL